jgi:hypothetical protein
VDIHSGGPGESLPFAASPEGSHLELAKNLNLEFIHTPGPTKNGFLVDVCQNK